MILINHQKDEPKKIIEHVHTIHPISLITVAILIEYS